MRFLKSKKGIALLATLVVAASAAIGAYAYFTTTGHGTGTATTGHATNFTVAQDAFGSGGSGPGPDAVTLYPGVGTQDLTGTVTNAGAGHQSFTTIVANIVAPTGTHVSDTPPCTAADYALTSPGSSWTITNGGDTATLTLPVQDLAPNGVYNWSDLSVSMNNLDHDQNACQDATVNLTYDVSTP